MFLGRRSLLTPLVLADETASDIVVAKFGVLDVVLSIFVAVVISLDVVPVVATFVGLDVVLSILVTVVISFDVVQVVGLKHALVSLIKLL